jgi:hypothetical protein
MSIFFIMFTIGVYFVLTRYISIRVPSSNLEIAFVFCWIFTEKLCL